jgi:hypothetical protein
MSALAHRTLSPDGIDAGCASFITQAVFDEPLAVPADGPGAGRRRGFSRRGLRQRDELAVDESPGRRLTMVGEVVLAQDARPLTLVGLAAEVEQHQLEQ